MSTRPKRNSITPAKFSSLSITDNKSNGDSGSNRRATNAAAGFAPDARGDSRSSTPVSGNSSSIATTNSRSRKTPQPMTDRSKQHAKHNGRKSRSLMQDVVDDDECDDGLEALDDETPSETSELQDADGDEDEATGENDDFEGSIADDNVSTVWSEATDNNSVASNLSKLPVHPRRPKSPDFIPDDADIPALSLPESSSDLCVSSGDVMLAVGVYEVLRRFRAIVRLSPFRFEDFCAALSASGVEDHSMLLVEIHLALIRALLREDDGNTTTFGPADTKDSITIAMHFVDAMTWYECTRAYLDSDPDSVEFRVALPALYRIAYSAVNVSERLRLLRTLTDLFLATNAVREELTNEGNITYDDHCRSCHRLGDLLCCDTCSAVYHLSCLENPLDEVPEEEWQCSICKLHQLKGVTDCVSEVEKSGLLCRQEPIGYDRQCRKYWFMCRRIIVVGDGENDVWYYSTVPQLEELMSCLDGDKYEKDLVQALTEMHDEIGRQMEITEELTRQAQAGRKSVLEVLNEAKKKKVPTATLR